MDYDLPHSVLEYAEILHRWVTFWENTCYYCKITTIVIVKGFAFLMVLLYLLF